MGRTRKPVSEQKGHLRVIDMQKRLAEEEMAAGGKTSLSDSAPHRCFLTKTRKKSGKGL